MKTFALAISTLAIGAAVGAGMISISFAAGPAGNAPFAQNTGYVTAEGAPCAPTMKDGRTPHYTWTAGYVQKARWEYHWACVL